MAKKWTYRGKRRRPGFVGRNQTSLPTKTDRQGSFGPAGPARSLLTGEIFPVDGQLTTDTWTTIGADCPWNSTPGNRQVWRNGKLVDVMPMSK